MSKTKVTNKAAKIPVGKKNITVLSCGDTFNGAVSFRCVSGPTKAKRINLNSVQDDCGLASLGCLTNIVFSKPDPEVFCLALGTGKLGDFRARFLKSGNNPITVRNRSLMRVRKRSIKDIGCLLVARTVVMLAEFSRGFSNTM